MDAFGLNRRELLWQLALLYPAADGAQPTLKIPTE
jgi:hypothetical protein